MRTYIQRRYNTVAQYIATRYILYLCEALERNQGAWLGMRWRKQAKIELEGARDTLAEAIEAHEDGMEE